MTYGPNSNREPSRVPYESEDLIEYYKRCIGQNEQVRGKQMREGTKVNF